MIVIGDEIIPFEEISCISSINDISTTKANSTLLFQYDIEILKYCYDNSLSCAVIVNSIKESIYSNALNSKYIICEKKIDINIQKIAENYMFDSKVLTIIENENEIETVAQKEIDGVIYKKVLGKL